MGAKKEENPAVKWELKKAKSWESQLFVFRGGCMRLKLYTIDAEYCNYLRSVDLRVSDVQGQKSGRPFVGVVLSVNGVDYFAPLSSPKPKHLKMPDSIDFIKIKKGEWGVINLNNMIPVQCSWITEVNHCAESTDAKKDKDYKTLIENQLTWCNSNKQHIQSSAARLRDVVVKGYAPLKLVSRCCDFLELEKACVKYKQQTASKADDLQNVLTAIAQNQHKPAQKDEQKLEPPPRPAPKMSASKPPKR